MINKEKIKKYAMYTVLTTCVLGSASALAAMPFALGVFDGEEIYNLGDEKDFIKFYSVKSNPVEVAFANGEVSSLEPMGYVHAPSVDGGILCVKFGFQNEDGHFYATNSIDNIDALISKSIRVVREGYDSEHVSDGYYKSMGYTVVTNQDGEETLWVKYGNPNGRDIVFDQEYISKYLDNSVLNDSEKIITMPIEIVSENGEVKYVAPVGYVLTKNDEGEMICVKYNDQNEERSR